MTYYLVNLLIYAAVDAMACLALNQQFGIAGITNFGFIIFQVDTYSDNGQVNVVGNLSADQLRALSG